MPTSRRGRTTVERERRPRRGRAAQRHLAVEQDAQTRPEHHAHVRGLLAQIRGGDGERGRRAAGTADAAVPRTRRPLVARRDDDERVQPGRAQDRAGERPVAEGGEGLGDADDRDPGGVERAAVGVRVDRALQAGQQLVGAAVDRKASRGGRLPAGDANRQDCRSGRDAADATRPAAAHEQARELRPVPLDACGLLRMLARECATVRIEHVDAVGHAAAEVRVRRIHAGVEQGDRHSGAVVAGRDGARAPPAPLCEGAARQRLRGERGRIGGAHRIDADHVIVAFEQGQPTRVDRRGETVERVRVDEVRDEPNTLPRELRRDLLLPGERRGRPVAHVRLARLAARLRDAVGEGRVPQDDDHPLADHHVAPLAVDESPPGRGPRACRISAGRALPAARQQEGESDDEHAGEPQAGQARDAYASRSRYRG